MLRPCAHCFLVQQLQYWDLTRPTLLLTNNLSLIISLQSCLYSSLCTHAHISCYTHIFNSSGNAGFTLLDASRHSCMYIAKKDMVGSWVAFSITFMHCWISWSISRTDTHAHTETHYGNLRCACVLRVMLYNVCICTCTSVIFCLWFIFHTHVLSFRVETVNSSENNEGGLSAIESDPERHQLNSLTFTTPEIVTGIVNITLYKICKIVLPILVIRMSHGPDIKALFWKIAIDVSCYVVLAYIVFMHAVIKSIYPIRGQFWDNWK